MYALFLAFGLAVAGADHDLTVLKDSDGKPADELFSDWLKDQAKTALDARLERYETLQTPEQLSEYQKKQREFFLKQLGPFPDEKCPLNARKVGELSGEGHRAEKIIFQSRPGHHVTGVLYLPTTEGPHPGVIVPCGHSVNGKAAEAYQRVSILLAQNGLAAFCYDPIGQGERYQALDENGQRQFGPTIEHTLMGVGSILVGANTASYRVYDGMRAIDYLLSRSDIDPEKIGCTGNSGGGTLTSFLMALDQRIQCAAPSCYLTTFQRLIDTIGPQDAEQNIYGQIAFGMDHPDYVIMRAPKPTLYCVATRDFFDIQGAWDNFRQAKRFYTRMDHAERVDLVETDATHGFSTQLRVGAVRWMRRWLLEIDDAIVEGDFEIYSDEDLQCTPNGQVMLLDGERSVFDLNLERDAELRKQRESVWTDIPTDQAIARVRKLVGVRELKELPTLQQETVGVVDRDGFRLEKQVLRTDDGRVLPALFYRPTDFSGEIILYVHGESKAENAGDEGPEDWAASGNAVLAVDLSGIGETEPKASSRGFTPFFGPDWKEYYLAYLLNRSIVGLRTEEILQTASLMRSEHSDKKIRLIGVGEAGVPALHAAALEKDLFESVRLTETIPSWAGLLKTPVTRNQLINTVHGALTVYDLPDLIASLGDKIQISE